MIVDVCGKFLIFRFINSTYFVTSRTEFKKRHIQQITFLLGPVNDFYKLIKNRQILIKEQYTGNFLRTFN